MTNKSATHDGLCPAPDSSDRDTFLGTRYGTISVHGNDIFYRESGPPGAPVILLLHGYPSSSRMFEPLFPLLNGRFRLIAPDYPGFGMSSAPTPDQFEYSFDNLAATMLAFTDALDLREYALYVQDYGGPVGMRLAMARPDSVKALVVQNAVVHEEGLSPIWAKRRAFWADRAAHEADLVAGLTSVVAGMARHIGGRDHPEHYDPDLWMDEIRQLQRPGQAAIQMALAYDYRRNLDSYPHWQAWLRDRQLPTLVTWGRHDPIFTIEGAWAFRRELPSAEVHILEAGHFALNDLATEIAVCMTDFLAPVMANGPTGERLHQGA